VFIVVLIDCRRPIVCRVASAVV